MRSRVQTRARVPVLVLMAIGTVAVIAWKGTAASSLLGLSDTFDYYALAVAWALVLWALGLLRKEPRPEPRDRTLDNTAWHLDSVRAAGLPEERSGTVGGVYLAWLLERGHLRTENLVGLDDSIAAFRAGEADVYQLYEDFGEKLTTSLMTDRVAAFSEDYWDKGRFVEDLEAVLGPDPLANELTSARIAAIHDRIDQRRQEWARADAGDDARR